MYGSVTLQTVMPPDFKIFNTFSLFVVFVMAEMSRTTHSDILCVFLLSSSRFGTLEADNRALLLRFIYTWDPQGLGYVFGKRMRILMTLRCAM